MNGKSINSYLSIHSAVLSNSPPSVLWTTIKNAYGTRIRLTSTSRGRTWQSARCVAVYRWWAVVVVVAVKWALMVLDDEQASELSAPIQLITRVQLVIAHRIWKPLVVAIKHRTSCVCPITLTTYWMESQFSSSDESFIDPPCMYSSAHKTRTEITNTKCGS